ncbi:outer dense fiber protein 3-like protein 2 [Adelges cooleyi]|uniref:outer dense fiber protein 3-like protein 2 n=1 Tax=Adelges cooleyi TaxID=133065 RepID=UPI0021806459|nr:outer dense fiber protein 3-like protein 2 [Adelges cooleyi]
MTKKQYGTPGPKYDAPTTVGYENTDVRLPRAPAFSLGQLLKDAGPGRRPQVPGPKYDLGDYTRHGPNTTPAAFLASRIKEPKRNAPTPSPAAYNITDALPLTMPAMPAYSLGFKRPSRKKLSPTPAPNAYGQAAIVGNRVPNLPSVPEYTILGRHDGAGKGKTNYKSPGPAKYSAVELDLYKKQTPRPVMLGTPAAGKSKRKGTPAPNAYLPPLVRFDNAPQYSLGERIAQPAGPYLTAADKAPFWE